MQHLLMRIAVRIRAASFLPALFIACALSVAYSPVVLAEDFVVDSVNDQSDANPGDGLCETAANECTLRAAIEQANALAGPDRVTFQISSGKPIKTIDIQGGLPPISDTLEIDGSTQPGASCPTPFSPASLLVELDGTGTMSTTNGLSLMPGSDGSTIRGLMIRRFGGSGLYIKSDANTVTCNIIGVDDVKLAGEGNQSHGIVLNDAADNQIGGPVAVDRNIVSGNGAAGLFIVTGEVIVTEMESVATSGGGHGGCGGGGGGGGGGGHGGGGGGGGHDASVAATELEEEELPVRPAQRNRIVGNYIGTNSTGIVSVENGTHGVMLSGSGLDEGGKLVYTSLNQIEDNLIAGNHENGVALMEAAMTNTIASNVIGLNVTGRGPLANGIFGIVAENSADNMIVDNVISGNGSNGVMIADPPSSIASTGNTLWRNSIGLGIDGTTGIPNGGAGVGIQNASYNTIGSSDDNNRNLIAGNAGDGVTIQRSPGFTATHNTIQGNYLGIDISGAAAVGNGGAGVLMFNAQNTTVKDNVVGGNSAGLVITAPFAEGNLLVGNYIGTDKSETMHFGNGEHGLFLNSRAHNNRIGGINPGEGNVIAYHSGRGIWMTAVGTNGNAIRGNSIYANQGDEIENKLGIDLAGSGPNPNDLGDIDDGPNKLQNFPDLTGAYAFDGATILNGHLNSAPNTLFEIDLFRSLEADGSGYGEGQYYLQTITVETDSDGNASFNVQVIEEIPLDQVLTTTATDPAGNTSEFSFHVVPTPALVVNTSNDVDDGACNLQHCSLREAILAVNAGTGVELIVFAITGPDTHTIQPQTPLPTLTHSVTIDGLTQPGATCPSDSISPLPLPPLDHPADLAKLATAILANGAEQSDSEPPVAVTETLKIELRGILPGAAGDGLVLEGGNSVVRGLAITQFSGNGLVLQVSGGNRIGCNLIGVDPEGRVARGNNGNGILIDNSAGNEIGEAAQIQPVVASSTTPGGKTESLRNLISANDGHGILINGAGATGNSVYGNLIGTDSTGTQDLGNGGDGIAVIDAAQNRLGENDPILRNVIAANAGNGIYMSGASNRATGNFIGSDLLGTTPLGNGGAGIVLDGGADATVEANLIAANGQAGIAMTDGSDHQIVGNYIGTGYWRITPLSNGHHGIAVVGAMNTVLDANAIAYSLGDGVNIAASTTNTPYGIKLQDNAIYGNQGLGIDLDNDGVTDNDDGDADSGANMLQNYPVISGLSSDDTTTTVTGTLNSMSATTYSLQFFVDLTCDPSFAHGEGRILLGSATVSTPVDGYDVAFSETFPHPVPADLAITATATDPEGNTSEFSACGTPLDPFADLTLLPLNQSGSANPGEDAVYQITLKNTGNTKDSFQLATAGQWPSSLNLSEVGPLVPGSEAIIQLIVTVPADAALGVASTTTMTATSVLDPSVGAAVMAETTAGRLAGVVLDPSNQVLSGVPGTELSYTLQVTNTGNGLDSYDVAVEGVWPSSTPPTVGPIGAKGSQFFTVSVFVPDDALVHDSDTLIVTLTSQSDPGISADATLEGRADQAAGVTLTPAEQSGSGKAETVVTYSLTLGNAGNGPDSYVLDLASEWPATLSVTETSEMAAGATLEVTVDISVPAEVAKNATNLATVTATSQLDPAVTASAEIRTTARHGAHIRLEPASAIQEGAPGQQVVYSLTVFNEGNGADSFMVTTESDWVVEAPAATDELEVGMSTVVKISVAIPSDAVDGESTVTLVSVTSLADPEIEEIAYLTTSVGDAKTYVPLFSYSGNSDGLSLASTRAAQQADRSSVDNAAPVLEVVVLLPLLAR